MDKNREIKSIKDRFYQDKLFKSIEDVNTDWIKSGAYWRHKKADNVGTCTHMLYDKSNWFMEVENTWKSKEEFAEKYKKWAPGEGEVCYFWNTDDRLLPIICKFSHMEEGYFISKGRQCFMYCIPYLGKKFWEFK